MPGVYQVRGYPSPNPTIPRPTVHSPSSANEIPGHESLSDRCARLYFDRL